MKESSDLSPFAQVRALIYCAPPGTRTPNPRIKSDPLVSLLVTGVPAGPLWSVSFGLVAELRVGLSIHGIGGSWRPSTRRAHENSIVDGSRAKLAAHPWWHRIQFTAGLVGAELGVYHERNHATINGKHLERPLIEVHAVQVWLGWHGLVDLRQHGKVHRGRDA